MTIHPPNNPAFNFAAIFRAAWSRALPCVIALFCSGFVSQEARAAEAAKYVIQISVDGLGGFWLHEAFKNTELPTFRRLQREGAWTHNARTDFDYTITLPNHTCMIACRGVNDAVIKDHSVLGHLWTVNIDPGPQNLHDNRHAYLASAFDVAHDHGLRTGLFATKSKFVLYDQSYCASCGAPDTVGENNGRDKIDVYVNIDKDSPALLKSFVETMKSDPINYSFVHLHDPDSAGHAQGWGSPEYFAAVKTADGYLGTILDLITSDPKLRDHTTVIISADHGGHGQGHFDNSNPRDYTIPFYVWGAGVAAGKDLYQLNPTSRRDPGNSRPTYADKDQPIRNGDGGNLALSLLGLPAIPDSVINAQQDLAVK